MAAAAEEFISMEKEAKHNQEEYSAMQWVSSSRTSGSYTKLDVRWWGRRLDLLNPLCRCMKIFHFPSPPCQFFGTITCILKPPLI